MAELLIESMESDWDPERYHDTHREKVEALIEEKRQGHEIVIQEPAEPAAKVVDLMEALNASIKAAAKPGSQEQPRPGAGQAGSATRADPGQEEGSTQGRQAGRPPPGVLTPAPRATTGDPSEESTTLLLFLADICDASGAVASKWHLAHKNRVRGRSGLISRALPHPRLW